MLDLLLPLERQFQAWPTPGRPLGISHILVAPGIGFHSFVLPGGLPGGVLNQSKSLTILKKSVIFALSLKQLSSSSFHMFIYARSEQCDLKFILVKISLAPEQRQPNSIHVSYYWEFIQTPLFTRVQIWRVFRFVQLWVNAFTWWYKWVGAYLGY